MQASHLEATQLYMTSTGASLNAEATRLVEGRSTLTYSYSVDLGRPMGFSRLVLNPRGAYPGDKKASAASDAGGCYYLSWHLSAW